MELNNLLVGGLHVDNDPAAQPPNTYREALNGNLIAYGNNKFTFESVKGSKVSFTLPVHAASQKEFTPIGWGSFTDRLIVLSADDSTIKAGEIGEVLFTNEGIGTYLPLYYHDKLNFSRNKPVRLKGGIICKPETSQVKRIYWTDSDNPYRSFNVMDSLIRNSNGTLKDIGTGNLVVGNKYMVLSNGANVTIVHNAVTYGPGHANTNIFTAVNANYTLSAYVVNYIPIETLDVVPKVEISVIDGKQQSGGGSLFCGSYQYFCQLETKDGGRTGYSYVTRPFYVYGPTGPNDSTISYARAEGNDVTENSNKKVVLTISGIDTNFYNIRVGFIRGTDYKTYEDPKIFITSTIIAASMEFTHYGNEVSETLQLNDLTVIKPELNPVGTVGSSKNISFVANCGTNADVAFTMASPTLGSFIYTVPADTLGNTPSDVNNQAQGYALFGHPQAKESTYLASVASTLILPGQWYEVVGGTSVTYNGSARAAGTYFIGVIGVTAITAIAGTPAVVAVIRIQQYTNVYKYIRIENDFCDLKGFLASNNLLGYWRGEKYRYGVMLWSKRGQPYFVNFLGDKTFPRQDQTTDPDTGAAIAAYLVNYDATSQDTNLRLLGALFSNLNFATVATAFGVSVANLPTILDGWSIVRVERDGQVVSQGLLFPTMAEPAGNTGTGILGPAAIDDSWAYNSGADNYGRRPYVYAYYSPDDMFKFDGRPSYAVNDKLKIADYYTEIDTTLTKGKFMETNSGVNFYYYKRVVRASASAVNNWYNIAAEERIADNCVKAINFGAIGNVPGFGVYTGAFNNIGFDDSTPTLVGYGAPVVILQLNANTSNEGLAVSRNGFGDHEPTGAGAQKKPLVNWLRPKSNLYGGTSDQAKAAHNYIWCGHYQAFDTAFMAYLAGNSNIADNVEVWGGDCYVNLFGVARTGGYSNSFSESFVEIFPCETNCNTAMRQGWNPNKDRVIFADQPPFYEDFVIAGCYNNQEHKVFYPARPQNFVANLRDEHIIYHSLEKTDGELIDSWKDFRPNNLKRVDGQSGPITAIAAKSSRLFYWQNKAVGYLPVHERITMGSALGEAIQLGVGGVLERFDELDFFYGCQHPGSLLEAEDFFGWFDMRRRAVIRMSFSGQVDRGTMVEGMSSFFQTVFDEIEAEASPNIFDSDNPIGGYGISSVYDSRFKLALMTFKFNKITAGRTLERDFTLGFSRNLDKYIGNLSINAGTYVEHNGLLLDTKIIRPNILANTAYVVGDEITDTTDFWNYVCLVNFTTSGAPTQPSSDATNWVLASKRKEIYVNWRNDYCKYHGIVYPFYISPIIRTSDGTKITVDNVEVQGNNTRFTGIDTSDTYQSGSDSNITTTNPNYKYVDGSWFFNLPLTVKRARLSDSWIQIKMSVRNYLTYDASNPSTTGVTNSINFVKRIFNVKSQIRKKR